MARVQKSHQKQGGHTSAGAAADLSCIFPGTQSPWWGCTAAGHSLQARDGLTIFGNVHCCYCRLLLFLITLFFILCVRRAFTVCLHPLSLSTNLRSLFFSLDIRNLAGFHVWFMEIERLFFGSVVYPVSCLQLYCKLFESEIERTVFLWFLLSYTQECLHRCVATVGVNSLPGWAPRARTWAEGWDQPLFCSGLFLYSSLLRYSEVPRCGHGEKETKKGVFEREG